MRLRHYLILPTVGIAICLIAVVLVAEPPVSVSFDPIGKSFDRDALPLVKRFCLDCHSTAAKEGELDLERFGTLSEVRRDPAVWQKVDEMLDQREMPPKDAPQPSADQRKVLREWVRQYLDAEARASAGDPGPVVLRRLNNAEYTYTLRDLTGVPSLSPAREFPGDGAAGEGFTNTGQALSMSPALVAKYLDAAKDVASHAVLLPDGIRFSPHASRRDWTEESLASIRAMYREFTDDSGGTAVNLQGIQFDTNRGGRLPVAKYLAATLAARDQLARGNTTIDAVAREYGLSAKYLGVLWRALTDERGRESSWLLNRLRARWRTAKPADAGALAADIARWQQSLWKFNSIGHIGKHLGRKDGPQAWMEPMSRLASREEFRIKLVAPAGAKELTLYLAATDAGDGNEHDFVEWESPRLVLPGRADLPLRDLRTVVTAVARRREQVYGSAAKCLAAAAEAGTTPTRAATTALAKKHEVDPQILAAWLQYLGIDGGTVKVVGHLARKVESAQGYDFVQGWAAAEDLSVVANSSDRFVRIPGDLKPHSIAVHPSPKRRAAIGWQSPAAATMRITGSVQHAHPLCGNGVTWALQLRRGGARQSLAAGATQGGTIVTLGPVENLAVQPGDLVSMVIGPRDGNHACDLTSVDLRLHDGKREWHLASEVSPSILAGNPHADRHGNEGVWHFYSEPDGEALSMIPAGSLLARWQSAPTKEEREKLASDVQRLLQTGPAGLAANSPDAALHRQLTSLSGPLLAAFRDSTAEASPAKSPGQSPRGIADAADAFGLDSAAFGKHPRGAPVDKNSLCVQAPVVIAVRLPADLVEGCEFVTAGKLHRETGREGSVQLQIVTAKPSLAEIAPALPLIVNEGAAASRRIEAGMEEFRQLFPAALCYPKIVPVDEVVTLTLYHREDEHLRRLMLDANQAARLDRLWDELHFVSQEPLLLASAFEQLVEYATQDRPDMVKAFGPMRQPIHDRAAAFQRRLIETEPKHVAAVLEFAGRAYRRPLSDVESRQLRELYSGLRKQGISHDDAIRTTLAKVLVSPAFLYRLEKPPPGAVARAVSDLELASRLSYFLWSSTPDEELLRLAAEKRLSDPQALLSQTRRMLRDDKTRRLATEFACQWLHIYDFDQLDEKSERHFPTFAGLRGAMYEESIQFFSDLFQHDGSVLSILDADYTFLNEELAKHYGVPGVVGPQWRRVEGVKRHARGGILTQATALAKQSGASRTSPILRGNWLSEVVLGEKLPRPPKNVPQLPETAPAGLTERQLIEKHSSDAACAKCHARIDPFGFALEGFDAIGRLRSRDAAGLAIDARTTLPDGTKIEGLAGLQKYLLSTRREAFVRQFNRKLLGYALGRSVRLSDEPLLKLMATRLAENGYNVRAAVELIVQSRQFREIRGKDQGTQE